ncbi:MULTISPECIES: DEAD/DEAH box helicase [unclassified Nocardioides]|uniref:DEAD/DEAH box helicase n=1 Tax=unclassified Nocardioides TaxID=2615069 RepID=UPI0006FC3096|nr:MULTISPECIES: DEAD/DEAH box helicase [unclassified Nocardioides]KRA37575.1 helicase [Nocardioides sp. Root614]KRA91536.1 helicase [Nocardioides sp. Root682]
MARGGQRGATQQRRNPQAARTRRNEEGIIPQLARAVREVEAAVARRSAMPEVRAKFQVVALLAREERARVKGDTELSDSRRGEELKRLDGIATILAQTAARDSTLFTLLDENAEISEAAKAVRRELLRKAGAEPEPEPEPVIEVVDGAAAERRAFPLSVQARQLANPFLAPDFDHARTRVRPRRLAGWELLEPLFRSFERAAPDAPACMPLPDADQLTSMTGRHAPAGRELMAHQAQLIASAAEGHRTYLLADEPGLGKTAQALLAAEAAGAFPLLAVVPNVVKTNWAREVDLWVPNRRATVLHGDGDDADGFADVFIVNYEILDRHTAWLATHGFRGMIVDEAHYIKNKSSQRSQNVLELSAKIRARIARPLLMALTGTPLINDIEDFRAIWQFLGWIDDVVPQGDLMEALEETGLTPADLGFYPAARRAVIDEGIVRRRKIDVASDIPARRIADMPVELEGEAGRSIRKAEQELARRMTERYDAALSTRRAGTVVDGIDHDLVRRVATWEREDNSTKTGENVFGMLRRIGQAKAGLAADYTAQLARNVGKVVFFAKHIDVMDQAEKTFAERGIKYSSIRGDQTSTARQKAIDAFVNDPEVQVAVCSLTAAGVGLNLQVASNLVLAELSWTDAEQTQAIDRVHRIGQDEPVTAWRIIATQTLDTRIAELIDKKAGLAARALDGAGEEVEGGSIDLQTEALVALLTSALEERGD